MNDTTNTATTPGANLKPEKVPGHWLLAKMGKRVLRPGGRELTNAMLDWLAITDDDDVVEFAPGLGATAELVLEHNPKSYTGVEREPAAVAAVSGLLRGDHDRCVEGTAQACGLDDSSADVVLGEAYITMQSPEHKAQIVAEAFRVLRPGGRFGLHELSLRPDDLDEDGQERVRGALRSAIRVGARPLTNGDWRKLLEDAGFEVRDEQAVGMLLLEPKRVIDDEGLARTLKIVLNVLRNPTARKRIMTMRATFREHRDNLGAITLIATKPA